MGYDEKSRDGVLYTRRTEQSYTSQNRILHVHQIGHHRCHTNGVIHVAIQEIPTLYLSIPLLVFQHLLPQPAGPATATIFLRHLFFDLLFNGSWFRLFRRSFAPPLLGRRALSIGFFRLVFDLGRLLS